MALQSDIELNNILKTLVPISNLPKDAIALIGASLNVQSFAKDYIIFTEGDNDEYAYYLLEGELELISTNSTNFHIFSETDDARYPLAQFQPRQYTAKAVTDSLVLTINRAFLDSLLVGNKGQHFNNGVEVNDIDNDEPDDWMSRILQSPLYINISVENIQKIFSRIESIDVKKGDVIIQQGDTGDYYYIIQMGRCCVSRKPTPTSQDINLAELREGDAFGEESIIANLKRNASVTMITDGRLMRLKKKDFKELILNPILQETDFDTAQEMAKKGAIWLDVRYPDEYQDYAIEGSLNIPLNILRFQVSKLDSSKKYIACCDTSSRSSIGAYILAQHGYDVLHLNKGLKDLLRHVDAEQIAPVEPTKTPKIEKTLGKEETVTNVVPFKNTKTSEADEHVLNTTFHDEMSQLRQELDLVRNQFKELENIKEIASEIKQSVISDTEKKLKIQRERINLQTQHANKLIQQAQNMHKELKNEKLLMHEELKDEKLLIQEGLKDEKRLIHEELQNEKRVMHEELQDEKRLIHEEVDKNHQEQEQTMLHIQDSINKRLLEEEKKMQAFYSWKESEIKKIRDLKRAAEQEYMASKIENELKNNDFKPHQSLGSSEKNVEEPLEKEIMNADLKNWLTEQVKNELLPINIEVQNAKRRLIEQANVRAEKSKRTTELHDQTLSSEIDTLLKGA